MSVPMTQAQPPLTFIQPRFDPLVFQGARSLLPFVLKWRSPVAEVQLHHPERLAELYQQFQAEKLRFLIAFRHPSTSDPLCISQFLWNQLPQVAQRQNIPLHGPTHAHFVYDRGIPLWAGKPVGWLFANLGGTPIRRGGVDRAGLRSIRHLFAHGQFPMAASPEGGTNGHNEIVSPIEPGIAQFGFWCVEDLHKAGRSQPVYLVPLGVQYQFVDAPWAALERLLCQIEQDLGHTPSTTLSIAAGQVPTEVQQLQLYQRLYALGQNLLRQMEQYYLQFYRHALPADLVETMATAGHLPDLPETEFAPSPGNEYLAQRLQTLLNAALFVAEQFFQVPSKGGLIDRCRRVEQAGWDRIYREDLAVDSLSPVEQGLADRLADEADLRLWHMRLVESFVSVTGRYVIEKPTVERFADTLLLIWKTVARIKGANSSDPPYLGRQQAYLTVGEPIDVSARWNSYQTNRRQAVTELTQDLQSALEVMIR
jgi:hypothetical protein